MSKGYTIKELKEKIIPELHLELAKERLQKELKKKKKAYEKS